VGKAAVAGLNIEAADLPGTSAGSYYPMELIRALTLTWLFPACAATRSPGCGSAAPAAARRMPSPRLALDSSTDAVCLLDIPVNKTGTAFTKPVARSSGRPSRRWQALRPAPAPAAGPQDREHVDLAVLRPRAPVGKTYINRTIIPALCAKAGVPAADVRGNITATGPAPRSPPQPTTAKEQ